MAVTVSFFNKFMENVGKGDINLATDTFQIILVNSYTFDGTDEDLADIGAVELGTANGYTAGGVALSGLSFLYGSGVTKFDAADASFTASGGNIGPTTGAIIYDTTATDDKLVCYIDFDGSETANDGTEFKITFNASGIFTVGEA